VASRQLTDGEDWQDFTPGSLMVFERGDVAYRAQR
jgi:predicted glutamine amidotransferase